MRLLVTGGAGFIGTNYVHRRHRLRPDDELVVIDKLTYAGRRENLDGVPHTFIHADVADPAAVREAMNGCEAVVHFAAESHVDRSLYGNTEFLHTAVWGTQALLEAARELQPARFVMVSTDEVYGPVPTGESRESDELRPSSPYAASKVAAERLAFSYWVTHGVPVLITRAANNYGPFQYPEKQLPYFTTQALAGRPITIYGDGTATRDWLHVDDHCAAIDRVLERGEPGGVYNIGAGCERSIVQNARLVLDELGAGEELLEFVPSESIRPGHDVRYAVCCDKLRGLGWSTRVEVEQGLRDTIRWYAEHPAWWQEMRARSADYFARHYGRKG